VGEKLEIKPEVQQFVESLNPKQREYLLVNLDNWDVNSQRWCDLDRLKTHLNLAVMEVAPYEDINKTFNGKYETWSAVLLLKAFYDILQEILYGNPDLEFKQDLSFFVAHHLKLVIQKYDNHK